MLKNVSKVKVIIVGFFIFTILIIIFSCFNLPVYIATQSDVPSRLPLIVDGLGSFVIFCFLVILLFTTISRYSKKQEINILKKVVTILFISVLTIFFSYVVFQDIKDMKTLPVHFEGTCTVSKYSGRYTRIYRIKNHGENISVYISQSIFAHLKTNDIDSYGDYVCNSKVSFYYFNNSGVLASKIQMVK